MLAPRNLARRPLADLLDGLVDAPLPHVTVADVAIDSRDVCADGLFLAFAGTQGHGLDYAAAAVRAGAAAIAWDRPAPPSLDCPSVRVPNLAAQASEIAARLYQHPADQLHVTGITGTDGKTSCAWLLAQASTLAGHTCGYLGTLGYGLATDELAPASHTTPDPVRLQDWLARLLDAGADSVAFEVSSHALAQYRADAVAFDVAVLTQIRRDHLDYHGDEARYAQAKRRLFERPGLRVAVLNADDAHGRAWLADLPAGVEPIAYGSTAQAAGAARFVALESVKASADGLAIVFDTHLGAFALNTPLVGEFNAHNLAAVFAVLLARDLEPGTAVDILARLVTVPGRMQRVPGRNDQPLVIVDYAHTPNALEAALLSLAAHADGQLFCVFGCGGDRDRGKRPLMGEVAARLADRVWITDDNPRGETPGEIVAQIMSGIGAPAHCSVVHDRGAAINQAIASSTAGDVVLIAGKGHETVQIVGSEKRAFDDRVVARQALEAA